jgi:hypothetical protein
MLIGMVNHWPKAGKFGFLSHYTSILSDGFRKRGAHIIELCVEDDRFFEKANMLKRESESVVFFGMAYNMRLVSSFTQKSYL